MGEEETAAELEGKWRIFKEFEGPAVYGMAYIPKGGGMQAYEKDVGPRAIRLMSEAGTVFCAEGFDRRFSPPKPYMDVPLQDVRDAPLLLFWSDPVFALGCGFLIALGSFLRVVEWLGVDVDELGAVSRVPVYVVGGVLAPVGMAVLLVLDIVNAAGRVRRRLEDEDMRGT